MRRLGAQSLRRICLTDISMLGPEAIQKCVRLFFDNVVDICSHEANR